MVKYVAKRAGTCILILVLGSLLMYVLTINSGDPLGDLRESNNPNRENLMNARIKILNLDKPWHLRYFGWLFGVSKCFIGSCDLGKSITGQQVSSMIYTAVTATLRLVLLATILAIIFGVILGIISAVRQYSGFDYTVTFISFLCYALPIFWAAVLLKEYASIQFNNWIVSARFSWISIVVVSLICAVVVEAAVGGNWKKRLITAIAVFVVAAGALVYFDAVVWFRHPAIGVPIFILASIGIATLVIWLGPGWQNRRVVYAVGGYLILGSIGYLVTRSALMKTPSWGLIFLCFFAAILLAIILGAAVGGFSRKIAIRSGIVVSLLMSLIAFTDLMLSNWSAYLKANSRPIATIGDATPNFSGSFWLQNIDKSTHLILPTVALTIVSLATYARYVRASMLDVLSQDYIRTARAKGLRERKVITKHAFRNSLIPLTTIVAFSFAGVIGGAIITETVFGWQGMGQLFVTGLQKVDPNPVMGFYLVTGLATVLMNMLADIIYAVLDPRIAR